jgi:hypothetical protein
MKCSDARTWLSQISSKSITSQISPDDLDFLCNSGYILRTSAADYDQTSSEVADLEQKNLQVDQRLQEEKTEAEKMQETASEDEKKTHGMLFDLHGEDYKDSMHQKLEADQDTISKNQVAISADEASISNYIQKKSQLDQLVPYGGEYLSLTGSGVLMLNALNARTSRVSNMEFSDYIREANETYTELRGIAQRANSFVNEIRSRIFFPSSDEQATS